MLTITSGESLMPLGSVFVAPFICDFSVSETCPLWSSWRHTSDLVRTVGSFLRPFLNVGDEWTRLLLETTTSDGLGFAEDVSRVGWTDALWPIVSSSPAALVSDTDRFSDKTGRTLKQNYKQTPTDKDKRLTIYKFSVHSKLKCLK